MAMFSVVGICFRNSGLFVQKAVVHGVEDFALHDVFELLEIDHEARARIHFALHRDFQRVVVSVAVGVVAFAEEAQVLVGREGGIVIVVRGGKFGFAREINHIFSLLLNCEQPMAVVPT